MVLDYMIHDLCPPSYFHCISRSLAKMDVRDKNFNKSFCLKPLSIES